MPLDAKKVIRKLERQHRKLETELNQLWWNIANNTRSASAQQAHHVELTIKNLYKDPERLLEIEKLMRHVSAEDDRILLRQFEMIRQNFAREAYPDELRQKIVSLSASLENKFSEYRPSVERGKGRRKTHLNEVIRTLKTSPDPHIRRSHWEAAKKVGEALEASKFLQLVALRNEAARRSGFKDFYDKSLRLAFLDPDWLDSFFEQLDKATVEPYRRAKMKLDERLRERYQEPIMPWHYEDLFFQEVPQSMTLSMDKFIKKDPVLTVIQFFRGLNLDLEKVILNSDLYERRHKNPHAFCIHIDRRGDVRILGNVRKSYSWLATLMHEAAHAAYFRFINKRIPYLLREPAHTFITEGVAMLMQRLTFHPRWLEVAMRVSKQELDGLKEELGDLLQLDGLIFSRWSLVMYNFERALYRNPHQDLQALWWDLKERYQFLVRPPGREGKLDWLSKIHLVSNPAYYHNYLLGLVFACQLNEFIEGKVSKGRFPYLGEELGVPTATTKRVGRYLKKRLFSQGSKLPWGEIVELATGAPFSLDAYERFYCKDAEYLP